MALRIPVVARLHAPPKTIIIGVERMSVAFTKFHLDDGRVLHWFRREERNANPHDHPWSFETEIIAGGYIEEVFYAYKDATWRSEFVHRQVGSHHSIAATHIHRIVELPTGECWTLVRAGPVERTTRFWRFGDDVRSRPWNRRAWRIHTARKKQL